MGLHGAMSDHDLISTGVRQCLLGLQNWYSASDHMEKSQKRVEVLEKELVASTAARRMAESNLANSAKDKKVAEARAVVALSRLIASEIELEVLRSRIAGMEAEMRDVVEKSKDTVYEEIEAVYLKQVKQVKTLV